jgi:hypothetical protein
MQYPPTTTPPPAPPPVGLDDIGQMLRDIRRHTRICAIVATLLILPAAFTALIMAAMLLGALA